MARGGISFNGLFSDHDFYTFEAASGLKTIVAASGAAYVEGKAVALEGNGVAGFGTTGNALLGVINKYEGDGYLTVQVRGCAVKVPGVSGSLPTAGGSLVVNGSGAVIPASSGELTKSIALETDTTNFLVSVLIG